MTASTFARLQPHATCPGCGECVPVVTIPNRRGEFYGRHRLLDANEPCPAQLHPAPSEAVVSWARDRAVLMAHDAEALARLTSRPEFYGRVAQQCRREARYCLRLIKKRVDPAPLMVTRGRHAR